MINPNSNQAILDQIEPSSGNIRKTNNKPKIVIERSPDRCHVRAKLKLEPSIILTTSSGASELSDFEAEICPTDNSSVTASVNRSLKLSQRKVYENAEAVKPMIKCRSRGFSRYGNPHIGGFCV